MGSDNHLQNYSSKKEEEVKNNTESEFISNLDDIGSDFVFKFQDFGQAPLKDEKKRTTEKLFDNSKLD